MSSFNGTSWKRQYNTCKTILSSLKPVQIIFRCSLKQTVTVVQPGADDGRGNCLCSINCKQRSDVPQRTRVVCASTNNVVTCWLDVNVESSVTPNNFRVSANFTMLPFIISYFGYRLAMRTIKLCSVAFGVTSSRAIIINKIHWRVGLCRPSPTINKRRRLVLYVNVTDSNPDRQTDRQTPHEHSIASRGNKYCRVRILETCHEVNTWTQYWYFE